MPGQPAPLAAPEEGVRGPQGPSPPDGVQERGSQGWSGEVGGVTGWKALPEDAEEDADVVCAAVVGVVAAEAAAGADAGPGDAG